MHRLTFILLAGLAVGLLSRVIPASEPDCGHATACVSCTGAWEEKKNKKTNYSITREHACVRGRDSWHAPPPECRCRPPCGDVIVKKRLYKADGAETVERVPKYEVRMLPAEPCGCAACRRDRHGLGWDPLGWLASILPW